MITAIIFQGLVLIIFSICYIVVGTGAVDLIKSSINLNNIIKNRTVRNILQVIMIVFWPIAGVSLFVGNCFVSMWFLISILPGWFTKNFE